MTTHTCVLYVSHIYNTYNTQIKCPVLFRVQSKAQQENRWGFHANHIMQVLNRLLSIPLCRYVFDELLVLNYGDDNRCASCKPTHNTWFLKKSCLLNLKIWILISRLENNKFMHLPVHCISCHK